MKVRVKTLYPSGTLTTEFESDVAVMVEVSHRDDESQHWLAITVGTGEGLFLLKSREGSLVLRPVASNAIEVTP